MKYDPKRHRRRSIRLKGYDYSRPGFYFITICIKNHLHLLGKVEEKTMLLNDAGIMVEKWYIALERKFPYIQCHEMIIMPNHIHFIIENTGMVGANQRVCPPKPNQRVGPEEIIKPKHLGSIIQWFKTMSTNEYIRGVKNLGWPPFYKKLWQRNYWEHIIRNEQAFDRISNYIRTNPDKWDTGF